MEVCGMMIHVDGNRKMNALGQKMKCKLEGKKIVQHVVCACVVSICVDGQSINQSER